MKLNELFEEVQTRVITGADAQDLVIDFLSKKFEDNFELISKAGKSSSVPDVIAKINGQTVQFEVKGRRAPALPVKIYETRIRRGDHNKILDRFISAYTNNEFKSFESYVDHWRKSDPKRGWPSDEGVVARAGNIYLTSTEDRVTQTVASYLLNYLHQQNDDFFVLYTKSNRSVDIYNIGSASDEISSKELPAIRKVILETYGSGGPDALRLALKVIFVN